MNTFNDFREKISIGEIAEQLGYWKSSSPGERYLCYSLGDKTNPIDEIVIYNSSINVKNTYFSRKGGVNDKGNLINFVSNRLDRFTCTKSGMSGVNEVLNNYLGSDLKINRLIQTQKGHDEQQQFNINYWNPRPLDNSNSEYLTVRRKLSPKTIQDFRSKYHIYIVGPSNHIGFPFRKPGEMDITNFEMRNYFPDNNVNYKAFCTGGNKSESCWIGNFVPFNQVTDIYLFESAIDAMSFYEIKGFSNTTTSAFVSTGGSVTAGQINKLKKAFPSIKSWHCCFDNDATGNCFDVSVAYTLKGEICKAYAIPEVQGQPGKIVHLSYQNGTKESFREEDFSSQIYLEANGLQNIEIIKPSKGKDWNDILVKYKRFDLNLSPTARVDQYIDATVSQLNLRGYHQLADIIQTHKSHIAENLSQMSSYKLSAPIAETTTHTIFAECKLKVKDYEFIPDITNIYLVDKSSQHNISGKPLMEYLEKENINILKDCFSKDIESFVVQTPDLYRQITETSTISSSHVSVRDLKFLSDDYKNLGYASVAEAIDEHIPSRINASTAGGSLNYKIENVEIQSAGAKKLYGDIVISKADGKTTAALENLCIKDKSTGLTEPFHTNGIDISKQPADTVKKLLSGSQVKTSSLGITQMLGLSKTPLGWGISIGKQIFNSADSSACI